MAPETMSELCNFKSFLWEPLSLSSKFRMETQLLIRKHFSSVRWWQPDILTWGEANFTAASCASRWELRVDGSLSMHLSECCSLLLRMMLHKAHSIYEPGKVAKIYGCRSKSETGQGQTGGRRGLHTIIGLQKCPPKKLTTPQWKRKTTCLKRPCIIFFHSHQWKFEDVLMPGNLTSRPGPAEECLGPRVCHT